MKIDVIPYASAIRTERISGRNAVVIDVLRAGSVMVTAMSNGARAFLPVVSVEEAVQVAEKMEGNFLLAGERDTKLIPGFHLGNSPLEYTADRVKGKTIILTTSNGTRALNALREASRVFIGTFLNSNALVDKLLALDDVVLVCSGTNDDYSMDDGMFAAQVIHRIVQQKKAHLSDLAQSLLQAYESKNGNLKELLQGCYHLNLLVRNGFEKDVEYCLQTDKLSLVPELIEGSICVPGYETTLKT
ncbi:MAG: 2-phosphosulfolactate phosphatase [Bacteroidales bacterium]|nr:2-phosphosulfolactate phosphatase [Bacteroidales bacterium]